MKKVLHKITSFVTKKADEEAKDPFYDFIVHSRSADKKRVYNRALEGADADQRKVMDEYQKKLELCS